MMTSRDGPRALRFPLHRLPEMGAVSALLGSLALGMAGCSDDPPTAPAEPQEPAEVTLDPEGAHLYALGETVDFDATVLDGDGVALSGVSLEWASSDPDVLEGANDGSFAATGDGTAEVTAVAGDASAAATVDVEATFAVEACVSPGDDDETCASASLTAHHAVDGS